MRNKVFIVIAIGIAIIIVVSFAFDINNLLNIPEDKNTDPTGNTKMLPIPALLNATNSDSKSSAYNIKVQEGITNFIGNQQTPTLGYNGSFLGPVIIVDRGEDVQMHVTNELEAETSIHWHGLEVEGTKDGGPHQVISAGSTWELNFIINQPASTLWFHPHVIGSTAIQVYYGLAGLIIIQDENSKSLNLPDEYGVNDIPLIIQDRKIGRAHV